MTLEQPASLNRLICECPPLTWRRRWQVFRVFVPLLVLFAVFKLETLGLALWIDGSLKPDRWWWSLLLVGVVVPALVFLLLEIKLRLALREQRLALDQPQVLQVLDNGVSFCAAGRPMIRWPQIAAFWFQDIPGETRLFQLTVEYYRGRHRRVPVFRRFVMEKSLQQPQLISKLTHLRQHAGVKFWIHLNQPVPVCELPRLFMRGLFLQTAGLLLSLHGMPLLGAVLIPRFRTAGSATDLVWPSGQGEKVGQFLAAHFASKAELQHFMLLAGATFTVLGLGLILWGAVIARAKVIRLAPEGLPDAGQHASSF